MKSLARGFTLVELLVVVAIIGIIAGVAIPNLLNALDKGKQKRSMSDLRAIGSALGAYSVDHNIYPTATSATALSSLIDPTYIKEMPMTDGWAHPFQVDSSPTEYTIYSLGKDGLGSSCTPGATSSFDDEICLVNGQFRRFPAGSQQ